MDRGLKRIVIISIYFFIFAVFAGLIYAKLKPELTCFDGVKNQNEEDVDCGGVCAKKCALTAKQDLAVQQTGFVPSGAADNLDIYGVVSNPNQTLGSGRFDYRFTVRNAAGAVIATKEATGFILPGETKYIIENNQPMRDIPAGVELTLGNFQWVEATEFYEKPQLKVVNKRYGEITDGIGFSEATGLLKNESPLDFASIRLAIILKDDRGDVVALNSTQMNTVQSGENRDFRAFWPNRFPGSVANMEVQPEVNVFDSESLVEKYFKPAKFQQY